LWRFCWWASPQAGNAAEWEEKFRLRDGGGFFSLECAPARREELKAVGRRRRAPPAAVFRLLGDYPRYREIMPLH